MNKLTAQARRYCRYSIMDYGSFFQEHLKVLRAEGRSAIAGRMAGIGASRPFSRVSAKVPSLNRHRPFALGRGNASSCPITDLAGGLKEANEMGVVW